MVLISIYSCTFLTDKQLDINVQLNFFKEEQKKETHSPSPELTYYFSFTPSPFDNSKEITAPADRLVWQGPDIVHVPILLYHHITAGTPANAYSVSQAVFRDQMEYLFENGYKTISMVDLVHSIQSGAELPQKPVMITFDDGNENVFLNAYPIMRAKGFKGIVLIIANRMNVDGFLSIEQLRNLIEQGWEIGSHGMRHLDLVKEPQALRDEISNSKKLIEKTLGLEISIFAYPYGKAAPQTIEWVKRIGYQSALGLGISNQHGAENLYYLQRREVKNEFGLVEFEQLLKNE